MSNRSVVAGKNTIQMEQFQDAASQQAKLIASRLTELLSRGQLWLRTELGVDLGLNPELFPPWVILLAKFSGLVLMVALWALLYRAVFKKKPAVQAVEESGTEVKRAERPVKEEPKKKKKKSEKKSQANGRAVVEPQEEAVEPEEIVPHHHEPPPPEVKTEKAAEAKKSKKKTKQAAKEPAKIVTADNKEPEEGTWETKVSNKEKREQRKKDKGSSDGSSSPGGGDTPVTTTSEQPKGSPAAPPANQKKKKGGDKVRLEKVETVAPKGPVKSEPAPVLAPEVSAAPPQALGPKAVNWTTNREPASLWGSEIDGSWTVIDSSSLGTFSALGVPAAEPKSVKDLRWINQPAVEDEWSGINGGSIDCNSDWNAPSEVWGNYEEPGPEAEPVDETPVSEPDKNNLLIEAADDDNEKEKDDLSGDGTTKSKRKKKKKKKKAAEEGTPDEQGEEPEKEVPLSSVKKQPSVQDSPASVQTIKPAPSEGKADRTTKEKQTVTQVPQKPADREPSANSSPPALTQQKKPEETQAPKPAKKKKARRET